MRDSRIIAAAVLLSCGMLLLSSCGTVPQTKPLFQSTTLVPEEISQIAVLPWVDLRLDKKMFPEFGASEQNLVPDFLKQIKYKAYLSKSGLAQLPNLTELDLQQPPAEWVKALPPTDVRWVMVVAVHDTRRNQSLLATFASIEMSAYLYDKQTGTLLWRHKAVGHKEVNWTEGWHAVHAAIGPAVQELTKAFPPHS